MSIDTTTALANAMLTTARTNLSGGFLFLFAGPVPATSDEALDMVGLHTQAVKISLNSTATGLTFDAPANGVLGKAAAETWSGVVATDGKDGAVTTITPTFYRFCPAADTGRTLADGTTGYRLQGSVGGPNSGADLQLGTALLTEGNTQPVGAFGYSLA